MLTKEEEVLYKRQIILPEIGLAGQTKIKDASVLVVGAGGLGCPVLQYLAAAGVGKLGIIDPDVVDRTNLHRQILFGYADVGKPKVTTAKDKLISNYPHIEIDTWFCRLDGKNVLDIFSGYDLIVDGSDNLETKVLINDACVKLGKPFVYGSIYKFQGQLSVFNFNKGPTYRCLFPEPVDSPSCEEIGVLGILPGIIGCLMANEALKIILGFENVLSGKLLVFDSNTLSYSIHRITANETNKHLNSLSTGST